MTITVNQGTVSIESGFAPGRLPRRDVVRDAVLLWAARSGIAEGIGHHLGMSATEALGRARRIALLPTEYRRQVERLVTELAKGEVTVIHGSIVCRLRASRAAMRAATKVRASERLRQPSFAGRDAERAYRELLGIDRRREQGA